MHGCVAVAFFGVFLSVPVRDVSSFGSCVLFFFTWVFECGTERLPRVLQEFCARQEVSQEFCTTVRKNFARVTKSLQREVYQEFCKSRKLARVLQRDLPRVLQTGLPRLCKSFARVLPEFHDSFAAVSQEFHREFRQSFAIHLQEVCKGFTTVFCKRFVRFFYRRFYQELC